MLYSTCAAFFQWEIEQMPLLGYSSSDGPGQTDYVRLWHIEEREEGEGGARAMGDEEGEWENGGRLTAAAISS